MLMFHENFPVNVTWIGLYQNGFICTSCSEDDIWHVKILAKPTRKVSKLYLSCKGLCPDGHIHFNKILVNIARASFLQQGKVLISLLAELFLHLRLLQKDMKHQLSPQLLQLLLVLIQIWSLLLDYLHFQKTKWLWIKLIKTFLPNLLSILPTGEWPSLGSDKSGSIWNISQCNLPTLPWTSKE
jgi:hypothetical protein